MFFIGSAIFIYIGKQINIFIFFAIYYIFYDCLKYYNCIKDIHVENF